MSASGCWLKRVWRAASSSVIWRLVSAMILTNEATGRPIGVLNRPRCGELGSSEARLYFAGSRIEGASPSGAFERCPDLGDGQPSPDAGGGCPTQDSHSVAMCQVPKRFQRCRIVFAQGVA